LILDDNWMIDYGNWEFNKDRFPNPKEMIRVLHELGFKVMLWVCPYVSPDSAMYRLLSKKGFLLQTENGESVIRQWWNGHSAMIDYSLDAAGDWCLEQLDYTVTS